MHPGGKRRAVALFWRCEFEPHAIENPVGPEGPEGGRFGGVRAGEKVDFEGARCEMFHRRGFARIELQVALAEDDQGESE
jgi:hypothetical protein